MRTNDLLTSDPVLVNLYLVPMGEPNTEAKIVRTCVERKHLASWSKVEHYHVPTRYRLVKIERIE